MNLIEQLGGYEKANAHFKEHMRKPDSQDDGLGYALLEYRRQNNIFEEGDRIECVDASKQKYLKEGKRYQVKRLDGHKIFLCGYARFSFLANRFKHYEGVTHEFN